VLFFIAACDAGQLRGVGGRGVAAAAEGGANANATPPNAAAPDNNATAVYGSWLARQYTAFTDRLFSLISRGAPPTVQAAAVNALLEAARHEEGPARLGGSLTARTVAALCRSRRAAPEALASLMQRYLPHADVSYYAMRAASKMAAQLGSAAAAAAEEEDESDGGEEEGDNDAETAAPAADQLRNLFDVLCHLPVMPPSAAARAADASAITKKAPGALLSSSGSGKDGDGTRGGEVPPTSWCGALEAGLATAASDSGASSKARRRKQQQQQAKMAAAMKQRNGGGAEQQQQQQMAVSWACGRTRRRAHAACWLSLLGCSLPADLLRKALVRAQQRVLPALPDPGRLADFYTSALDAGGLDGMLALNGLFVLVTRHGLEYPRFYTRLYGLLGGSGTEASAGGLLSLPPAQRARFLKLADAFLASPAVPAYSAAAFAKRFARVALRSADPGLALVCLAFVHNLVRRHPSCMVLLHRPLVVGGAGAEGGGGGDADASALAPPNKKRRGANDNKDTNTNNNTKQQPRYDVYDEAAEDPADSRAVESSLWEVGALRRHHCPHVAALAHKVAGKDLADRKGTAEMDVTGLLEASAGTLAAEDFGRRLKAAPPTVARADAETAALTLFGPGGGEGEGGVFFEGWRVDVEA
jgi:U3 small nucleolar RNA-associated protein 19